MTPIRTTLIVLSVGLFTLIGCSSSAPKAKPVELDTRTPPPANREFRAAWVATVGNIDWPSKKGLSAQDQMQEAIAILDKSVDLNLNAIVLQVRTSADALYRSEIEPWSEFLTGEQGKDPGYDPLQFWVEEAHKRGLELHAWFNPYRAMYGGGDKENRSKNHIWNTNRAIVKEYGGMLWLDPGEEEAEKITVGVFLDVVKRYDVDGIHIDDYFYPYPVADRQTKAEIDFPDEPSWKKYQASGGTLSRGNWRRENINRTIKDVYEGVHQLKPWVKFGISPFGIPRAGRIGTVAGFDQYEKLYADAQLWLENGWLDYWTPQLYWKLSAPQQSYEDLLNYWIDHNPQERNIYPGLFTSKIQDRPTSWPAYDVLNQVWVTQQTPGAGGNVHFSMKALMQNREGISNALLDGPYRAEALVPASPWLDDNAAPAPKSVRSSPVDDSGKPSTRPVISTGRYPAGNGPATYPSTVAATQPTRKKLWTGRSVTWEAGKGEDVWQWAVYAKQGTRWTMQVVPGDQLSTVVYDDAARGPVSEVYVSSVDRCGNESRRIKAYHRDK